MDLVPGVPGGRRGSLQVTAYLMNGGHGWYYFPDMAPAMCPSGAAWMIVYSPATDEEEFHMSNVFGDYSDAFYAINAPVAPTQAIDNEEIKRKLVGFYDFLSKTGLVACWNWGLWNAATHAYVVARIPDYTYCATDGLSELLYCYTLTALPGAAIQQGKILEVGCGSGAGLNFLSRLWPDAQFVGVDLSGTAVKSANSRLARPGKLSFFCGDAEHLPFGDGEFDAIINVESSHNYPEFGKFLAEASRVLRPGGYLSMVDVMTQHRWSLVDQCIRNTAGMSVVDSKEVSEDVRNSIRRRMAPNSFYRRTARGNSWFPMSKLKEAMALLTGGAAFVPERGRWARTLTTAMGRLSSHPPLDEMRYLFYLVRKPPC
jgi:SAM-dependent methyltransferase